jgi:hypothetical protein
MFPAFFKLSAYTKSWEMHLSKTKQYWPDSVIEKETEDEVDKVLDHEKALCHPESYLLLQGVWEL